ncbi:MAG TPA: hypothetical protein PLS69_11255 [Terricaulis sp.]|nr:hypothetical protein [Terricaulis sp.]HRP09964.1 hypothetical protein [Terricaulis sp.]
MLDLLFIGLLQASVATADPAPAPAPAATETTQAAPAAQEERRCRMVRMEGSNIRQRRCTTAAEDEAFNAATAAQLREMQSQGGRGAMDNPARGP